MLFSQVHVLFALLTSTEVAHKRMVVFKIIVLDKNQYHKIKFANYY